MRVNEYKVLDEAISAGVACGWRRAHKHEDQPSAAVIQLCIEQAVLEAICEAFVFEDMPHVE